jgi:hypothetical protein
MATIEAGQPAQNTGQRSHGQGGDGGAGAGSTGQPRGIAQLVRDTTYQQLDGQKDRASQTLGSLAGAVRGMTQPLRDGGQTTTAEYVNKAADNIEQWAEQLRQQDITDALRSVERFARREPGLFLGIAFGTGLLAARFLKSSSRAQDEDRRWETGSSRSRTPLSQMAGPDAIPRVGSTVSAAQGVV